MSLPTTAPAVHAASSTEARHVSTDNGTSKRARERLDRGDDPIELLGLAHLRTGPRLDAADVEEVGAVEHELLGAARNASNAHVAPRS